MSLIDAKLLQLPKIEDLRGSLSFIESYNPIPFEIKRVYFIYDVPANSVRGSHAHKKLKQLIGPLSGSFDVNLDDGESRKCFSLRLPYLGLYVPELTWRTINNFSSGSVCMVLASDFYKDDDYIRDYETFLKVLT